jgi:hypothetical protein
MMVSLPLMSVINTFRFSIENPYIRAGGLLVAIATLLIVPSFANAQSIADWDFSFDTYTTGNNALDGQDGWVVSANTVDITSSGYSGNGVEFDNSSTGSASNTPGYDLTNHDVITLEAWFMTPGPDTNTVDSASVAIRDSADEPICSVALSHKSGHGALTPVLDADQIHWLLDSPATSTWVKISMEVNFVNETCQMFYNGSSTPISTGFDSSSTNGSATQLRIRGRDFSGDKIFLDNIFVYSGTFIPQVQQELENILQGVSFFNNSQTKFTGLSATGTSNVTFTADYSLDGTEIDTSISELNPSQVRFAWSLRPTTNESAQSENITVASGTGSIGTNVDVSGFTDGTYDLFVKFTNLGCTLETAPCPFPQTYMYTDFVIASGTLQSFGTVEIYDRTSFDFTSPYSDCSLTELGGCLRNVLAWAFVPSNDSVSYFTDIYSTATSSEPFSYAYEFRTIFDDLYQSSSTVWTISMPSTTPVFGNMTLLSSADIDSNSNYQIVRDAITVFLYLSLIIYVYLRVRRLTANL